MYSYGPPHMAELKQDNLLEHTYSSYVRIRDVAQKSCQGRWTIGKSSKRRSGISVLAARHDDDDDDPSFHFLSVLFYGQSGQQSPWFWEFSFFVDYYKICLSGRDLVIRLYVKIPDDFVCVILQERCWIVHIIIINILIRFLILCR